MPQFNKTQVILVGRPVGGPGGGGVGSSLDTRRGSNTNQFGVCNLRVAGGSEQPGRENGRGQPRTGAVATRGDKPNRGKVHGGLPKVLSVRSCPVSSVSI